MLNKNKMLFAVLAVNNGTYPICRCLYLKNGIAKTPYYISMLRYYNI